MSIEKYRTLSGDSRSDDEILEEIGAQNGEFLFVKGFLSDNEFDDMSKQNKKSLETPIHDKDGNVVDTPGNWFITGHNIAEKF
jgi:hypothetical protein